MSSDPARHRRMSAQVLYRWYGDGGGRHGYSHRDCRRCNWAATRKSRWADVQGRRRLLRGRACCLERDDSARPSLIVHGTGTADVIEALTFARHNDLEIAVRGGGHNVAGKSLCADGMLIDCSTMKGFVVDPTNRTVRAQSGVLWGELDRETRAFGLATPGGVVSATGIAGLTLGGGFGWLMRKHGLTCDNVLSFNLVTADGTPLVASEEDNADLFWALRGGGANLGVMTSVEYRCTRSARRSWAAWRCTPGAGT